jgi:hypothetical protein
MQLVSSKPIIAILCVSAAFVIGLAGNADSFWSWTVLSGVPVIPLLAMMWRWNDPRQAMSESLHEVRR